MWSFIKQFFIYGFASVIGKIAAVFLMPIYTSVLTPGEYGAMALLISCKGIIDLFSNLNIHSGIARDYYEDGINRKKLVSTGFFSILFFSVLVLLILFFSRNFWTQHVLNIQGYDTAFVLMLLSIPAGSLLSYFAIITRMNKKAFQYSVGVFIQLTIQISISVYLVVVARIGINGIFWGLLLSELIGIIYYFFLNHKELAITFYIKYLKNALKYSLPTLPAIMAGWIDSSLGQVLIGKYISLDQLGVYSIALQISSVFLLLNTALNYVWFPYVYENYKKPDFLPFVNRLFKMILWLFMLIVLNLSFLSKDIVLLLATPQYIGATHYIALLSFSYGIYLLLNIVGVGANISKDTKYLSIGYIAGSVANLVLLILFLPRFGILFVPIGLIISRLVNYVILYNYTKKIMAFSFSKKLLFFFFLIAVFGCVLSYIEIPRIYLWGILLIINLAMGYYINYRYGVFKILRAQLLSIQHHKLKK